jgi:hypothetical protein
VEERLPVEERAAGSIPARTATTCRNSSEVERCVEGAGVGVSKTPCGTRTDSRIAQWAERRSPKPKVQGSTPCAAATKSKHRPASSEDKSTGLRSRGSHVRIVRGAPSPGLRAELVTAAACKAVALAARVVRVHGNPPKPCGHRRLARHLCSTQIEAGPIPVARLQIREAMAERSKAADCKSAVSITTRVRISLASPDRFPR